jgi:TRAP-type C4-dicarboxylate transport system permease small subunit
VLNADGEFAVADEPIDLSVYAVEDWLALGVFTLLGVTVFTQFFTRYGLNDSAAWTEEIARYLLVATVFIGIVGATRRDSHIHVDFFYHFLPRPVTRVLATLVDLTRIAFFAYGAFLTYRLMGRIGAQPMSVAPIAIGWVYGVVLLGFAAAALRAVQVAVRNWRRGYSRLERPDLAEDAA